MAGPDPNPLRFEQSLQRLEDIVSELENNALDLDTALARYEEGVMIARQCLERLQTAELRIQSLSLE